MLTGASSGIGVVAAEQLVDQGNQVAVVGRNPERTRAVAERIGATPFLADFERLDDVRALADALLDRYERIDVLANNAGGLNARRELTVDGHERTIQANHLAPFLLTNLLLPRLHRDGRPRATTCVWSPPPASPTSSVTCGSTTSTSRSGRGSAAGGPTARPSS